ncbi:MAG TPA: hypothetical protein VFB69_05020 [Candidatus Dormibacteraeota bacterium]|nr:hypothetical protein [Candidatus Dormibacteraeota bacterium]
MSGPRRERWLGFGPVKIGISLPFAVDRRVFRSSSRPVAIAIPAEASEPLPARRPAPSELDRADRPLRDRVGAVRWFDSIDVGDGVVTPGVVDRRRHVEAYDIPPQLTGKRCLEVTAHDGFWSFEMERRHASAVVSAGLPNGPDAAFAIAREALGSSVARERISVLDLSPELTGTFDLVVVDGLLGVVRDPQRVLDRVRSVCRGSIRVIEAFDPSLEGYGEACLAGYRRAHGGSWSMNVNTIAQMLRVAGFARVTELARIFDAARSGRTEVVLGAEPDESERMLEPSKRLIEIR